MKKETVLKSTLHLLEIPNYDQFYFWFVHDFYFSSQEGESSQDQESSVHPSTPPSPPLPASPTPTTNTVTTGDLAAEGSIDQDSGQQGNHPCEGYLCD